jgi:hypothetical protein
MNKIFILILIIFAAVVFPLLCKKPEPVLYREITENNEVTVESLDIVVPESLKINFKNGTDYCKTQNIAQNGAFEICVLYYIYERSKTDHEIILKINTYCDKTTTNECDRRNCVENIILF